VAESLVLADPIARDTAASDRARVSAAFVATFARVYSFAPPGEIASFGTLLVGMLDSVAASVPDARRSAAVLSTVIAATFPPDLAVARAAVDADYERVLLAGDDGSRAQCAMLRAELAEASGDVTTMLAALREAYAGDGTWIVTTVPWVRAKLVQGLCLAGEVARAAALLADLTAVPHAGLYAPDVAQAEAAVAAASGQVVEAIARLRAAGADAGRRGDRLREFEAWWTLLRLGDRSVAGVLARRARAIGGPVRLAIAAFADAVAAGTPGDLERAANVLAAAGLGGAACDAQAAAVRAHRTNDEHAARLAVERLARLVADCPGLHAWNVVSELNPQLTDREREVAELAATLSDKEIAARLGIAQYTVQKHLTRVYRKLNIAGRRELRP
jgi:DNA-binding CsgD family transcriptional regulator